MQPPKAIFCWSGGKDSALALHKILQSKAYEVCYLLTTVNGNYHRISMHGVRESLLDAQAASIGIPQIKVYTYEASNEAYEKAMEAALLQAKSEGIEYVIFGDIFLEDLRLYREKNLAKVALQAVFPLWKQNTTALIQEFLQNGFKTITCCVNDAFFDEWGVGVLIDDVFIKNLPQNVDPCGENGEFHTFCFDGPIFKKAISFQVKEKVYKALEIDSRNTATQGFWYCELK